MAIDMRILPMVSQVFNSIKNTCTSALKFTVDREPDESFIPCLMSKIRVSRFRVESCNNDMLALFNVNIKETFSMPYEPDKGLDFRSLLSARKVSFPEWTRT
jgi:hypothetical protein